MAEAKDRAWSARQSSTIFGGDVEPAHAAGEADVHEARAKELWEQLLSFDLVCTEPLKEFASLADVISKHGKGKDKGRGKGRPQLPGDDGELLDQDGVLEEDTPLAEEQNRPQDFESDSEETRSASSPQSPPQQQQPQRAPPVDDPVKRLRSLSNRLLREVYRLRAALPALACRGDLQQRLARGERYFVVRGATGSGKSTQLPQFLAEALCDAGRGKIICTQPRKVAATALALRVAEEWSAGNEKLAEVGQAVGYRLGAKTVSKPWTQIEYMTEGTLLQLLMRNRAEALRGVRAVILDEAHERTVRLDLLLGWLKKISATELPTLCLVVTSATLDVELFSSYLRCASLEIAGRMFPVEDRYEPPAGPEPNIQQAVVRKVIDIHKTSTLADGDVLAFLPDPASVESARDHCDRELSALLLGQKKFTALCLHGGQEPDEQRKIFERCEGRKIVFSTGIAETSVTIDGVRFVVDSGVEKTVVYDARRNINSLEVVAISRSSAVQRRGRAGRTAPGVCYRLYSADDFDAFRATQAAEVLSQPAHLTLLTLLRVGLDPQSFDWLEKPSEHALKSSWATLEFLSAVEKLADRWALTEFGSLAATLQINPCWAKLLHEGCRRRLGRQAADLAAILDNFPNLGRKATDPEAQQQLEQALRADVSPDGDIVTMFRLYRTWVKHKIAVVEGIAADERRAKMKSCSAEAAAFAREKGLRSRGLDSVKTVSAEHVKQLDKFGCLPANIGEAVEEELTDEQLKHLIFAGCFLNLGVVAGSRDGTCRGTEYQLVEGTVGSSDSLTAGAIFPGSVLVRQIGAPPKFVCFASMMQTSRLWLHGVTPLEFDGAAALIAKVRELSGSFADHLAAKLPNMEMKRVEVTGFTQAALSGNRARQQRLDVQERFACTVAYEFRSGAISCFCRPKREKEVRDHLEGLLKSYQDMVQSEVLEELLGGDTRVVYAQGGQVACMLYPGECITVLCSGLRAETQEGLFRAKMERYGAVRSVSIVGSKAQGQEADDVFGAVTFVHKSAAAVALAKFRKEYEDVINVRPGGIRSAMRNSEIIGCLRLQWDVTEQQIEGVPETADLSIAVSELRKLVPFVEQAEMQSFFFERGGTMLKGKGKGKGRGCPQLQKRMLAGLRISYPGGADQVHAALKTFRPLDRSMVRQGITPRMADSLSCVACFQTAVSVHNAIYDHFQVRCPSGDKCQWIDCCLRHEGRRAHPCRSALDCQRPKVGESACRFLHPKSWYPDGAVHGNSAGAQDVDADPVGIALYECRAMGVEVKVSTKGQSTTVRMEHSRIELVEMCRSKLVAAFAYEPFVEDGKDLLFLPPGVRRLQEVQRETKAYIHWDKASRTVRIFGRQGERQVARDFLARVVQDLSNLRHDTFILQGKAVQKLRGKRESVEELVQETGLVDIRLWGSTLAAWGEAGKIDGLRQVLEARDWLRRAHLVGAGVEGICGLCMCDFDESTFQLQACGHRFCTACLKGAFANPDGSSFPIACPQPVVGGGMCRRHFVWRDVVALCSPDVIARIKRLGVDTYLREQPRDAVYCPRPGCNHVLKPPEFGRASHDDAEEGRRGGRKVFCECCSMAYCLECTNKMGKPMPSHTRETCAEAQTSGDPGVQRHRIKIVNEILTLKCPRTGCKRPFYEYDGCPAVKCDTCGCGFCAKCFKDCGADAHAHANTCNGPPFPHIKRVAAGLGLSTSDFHRLNLEVAEYKVQEYLSKLPLELRKAVQHACRVDFSARPGGNIKVAM